MALVVAAALAAVALVWAFTSLTHDGLGGTGCACRPAGRSTCMKARPATSCCSRSRRRCSSSTNWVEDEKVYREALIPAAKLNEHRGTLRRLTDDQVDELDLARQTYWGKCSACEPWSQWSRSAFARVRSRRAGRLPFGSTTRLSEQPRTGAKRYVPNPTSTAALLR
jgi:hypothetical protein